MKNRTSTKIFLYPLLLILMVGGFSACKNKKKATEISDPQEVKAQMEEELKVNEEGSTGTSSTQSDRVATKSPSKSEKLTNQFSSIAQTNSIANANNQIRETLSMFSNPDVPVLIIIYQEGETTDYDEPTTIEKYLNYLKDTKQGFAKVEEMVLDENGKIKELVLRK